jgi:hypothetical protein
MKTLRRLAVRWEERSVPQLREHFEVRVDHKNGAPDSSILVARVGRRKRHLSVEFVIDPSSPQREELVAAVTAELDSCLLNSGGVGAWAYAMERCATATNLRLDVHWRYMPEWDDPDPHVFCETFAEQTLYQQRDPRSQYAAYQWPHRKGIFSKGQFPVAVARLGYEKRGYRCYVSLTDKHGLDSYLLEWRPRRRRTDRGYKWMEEVFGTGRLEEFHRKVADARAEYGVNGAGGDPDLFVQADAGDRFFVEVKMEYRSNTKRFRDSLNDQQRIVFPLIEQVLGCRVRVAKVFLQDEAVRCH